jgi:antitoxin VapB
MATAKVFWSGKSQAVHLPKDFRFPPDTEEVEVYREGGRIVLEPVQAEEWPESFWRAFEGMPEDFERPPQVRQIRESFDL